MNKKNAEKQVIGMDMLHKRMEIVHLPPELTKGKGQE
jgi:hypothetical protein